MLSQFLIPFPSCLYAPQGQRKLLDLISTVSPSGAYSGLAHRTQSILVEYISANEANAGTERQGNWPILGHSRDDFCEPLSHSPIRRGQMERLIWGFVSAHPPVSEKEGCKCLSAFLARRSPLHLPPSPLSSVSSAALLPWRIVGWT